MRAGLASLLSAGQRLPQQSRLPTLQEQVTIVFSWFPPELLGCVCRPKDLLRDMRS
jgi:hypothetical protein